MPQLSILGRAALIPAAILALTPAAPVQAQSMDVRWIVENVVGEVCGPFMRGDVMAALTAAQTLGYRQTADSDLDADNNHRRARVTMTGDHAGTLTIIRSGSRVLCSIGISEGGVSQINGFAEEALTRHGFCPALEERGRWSGEVAVWTGVQTVAVIHTSPHFPPGSELTMYGDTWFGHLNQERYPGESQRDRARGEECP